MTREEQRELKKEKIEKEKRDLYYSDELAMPPECEPCCMFRSCYNKYENKGSYTPGRGYTSYYSQFYPACGTRLNSGCPDRTGGLNDSFDMTKAVNFLKEKLKEYKNSDMKKKEKERLLNFILKLIDNMENKNLRHVEEVKKLMEDKENMIKLIQEQEESLKLYKDLSRNEL